MSDQGAANDQVLIIRGAPTADEVAAVVAAVTALAAAPQTPPVRRRGLWNAPGRQMRPRLSAGPGAWRTSALPR